MMRGCFAGWVMVMVFGLTGCAGTGGGPEADWSKVVAEGVSQELASWRTDVVRRIDYDLELELEKGAKTFDGRCRIRLDLSAVSESFVLDFKGKEIRKVEVNGKPAAYTVEPGHILLPGDTLALGQNEIVIDYVSGVGAAGEGLIHVVDEDDRSEYVYSLNVPADGHGVFPCCDQPDLKASYRLTVTAPHDWKVITNSPLASREATEKSGQRWRFAPTERISTYLFAFAAGPFAAVEDNPQQGIPMVFYGRKSQSALLKKHAPECFRLHREALAFFEDYFDVPYPFAKFDFVCVPDFPFSGMEHPGCIFYGESPMLFRQEVTRLREARRADLISHETAHMWFGDLVTMPWFDDVWLKEGFATYMAHKCLEKTFTGIDHARNFFLRNHPSALDTDITSGARPIRLPLGNLADAKSNYGPIIYRKGPVVLRQLELMIGSEPFQTAVQGFLKEHSFKSARWEELKAAFEGAWPDGGPGSLDAWSRAWIESPGVPAVTVSLERGADGTKATLVQKSADGSGRLWPLSLLIGAYDARGRITSEALATDHDHAEVGLDAEREAAFAFANEGAGAYAFFLLDDEAREYVVANFSTIKDRLLRALLWQSLWNDVLEAKLAPQRFVELGLAEVFFEDDQRVVSTVLSRMAQALSVFVVNRRDDLTQRFEGRLFEAIEDPSLDRNFRLLAFRTLDGAVRSEAARKRIRRYVDGSERPPQLPVSLEDRWTLLQRLMLLDDEQAEGLFAKLKAEDSSDEGKRHAFLVLCARPDLATKRELFQRFREDAELPERWVQNGADVFFASGQAEMTDEFVQPALDQLTWISQNRKIFFLPAWVNAVVRSRKSSEALAMIENFVESGDASDAIKTKTRVALDHLRRALKIRAAQTPR